MFHGPLQIFDGLRSGPSLRLTNGWWGNEETNIASLTFGVFRLLQSSFALPALIQFWVLVTSGARTRPETLSLLTVCRPSTQAATLHQTHKCSEHQASTMISMLLPRWPSATSVRILGCLGDVGLATRVRRDPVPPTPNSRTTSPLSILFSAEYSRSGQKPMISSLTLTYQSPVRPCFFV